MEFTSSDLNELGDTSERNKTGKNVRGIDIDDDGFCKFKSKNLQAERRRRQRISDGLLELRSLVPNITNMKKATIICDAIDYITELQGRVRELSNELLEMENDDSEEEIKSRGDENDEQNMKKWGIETEVKVIQIDYNKLWIKLVYNQKRGSLTKLMEAMIGVGYEFTDTSVTTSKGAVIVTSCLEGMYGVTLSVEETKELLLNIISNM